MLKHLTLQLRLALTVVTTVLTNASVYGQQAQLQVISLPRPRLESGKPLMTALSQRRTIREFEAGSLNSQTMGELLWAAFGVNRPENDHRTAPSAMNSQEVDVYVALAEALYVYDHKEHALKPVLAGDFRGKTTGQAYAKEAAAVLIYVADLPRLGKAKPDTRQFYAAFDAGTICQNVYLYCASADLATVVYDLNRKPLSEAMKLREGQEIIMAQAVGLAK